MLRYLETVGLVVPSRTRPGTGSTASASSTSSGRSASSAERSGSSSTSSFAARLRREPELRDGARHLDALGSGRARDWVEWEQRKHERLISAA